MNLNRVFTSGRGPGPRLNRHSDRAAGSTGAGIRCKVTVIITGIIRVMQPEQTRTEKVIIMQQKAATGMYYQQNAGVTASLHPVTPAAQDNLPVSVGT